MQIAIQTPPEHVTFPELRDVWQAADELGFRAGFTFDHFVPLNPGSKPLLSSTVEGAQPLPDGPQLEGWTVLTALAALTTNLEVGTLVTGVTYRNPVLLAKIAVTLDHITGGRAILGLGAAWHEKEHHLYGFDYPGVGERMGRLEEALIIFDRLCTEERVDFDGQYYQLREAPFDPKPVRPGGIPVLIGGSGPRLKRIVGRRADIFNSFSAPWEWAEVNAELDANLAKAGREPGDLERSAFLFGDLSGDPAKTDAAVARFAATRGGTPEEVRRRIIAGTPDEMIAVLKSYEAAGVGFGIINLQPPYPLEGLARFAAEVLPAIS